MAAKGEKDKAFIGSGTEASERLTLHDFVSGKVFTRKEVVVQLPFIFFLTFLAFIYISNHFKVEKLLKEASILNREIEELRIEAISTSSDLMYFSKQSVILDKVRQSGGDLEELTEPPRRLVVKKK